MEGEAAMSAFANMLEARGVTRRDFMKLCGTVAAAAGLSQLTVPQVAQALETSVIGATKGNLYPVIWVEGASCTGCTESFAQAQTPNAAEVVLDMISLNYSETLSAAAGYSMEEAKAQTIAAGNYILIYEGAVLEAFDGNALRVAGETGITAGLFTYPCLMAADILMYDADFVPVGVDQKQHVELTRDIAIRFNGLYGNTFRLPEAYIPKTSARIMSLADPTKKMSKSDENVKATVFLLDPKDSIIKKFKSAVTDSEAEVVYREGKDGINNLMSIYSAVTGKSFDEIQQEFAGRGYGDFKMAVGEAVAEELRPIREEYERLMADKGYLESCYREGAEKARAISQRTLDKVYKKIGFLPAAK